MRKTHSNLNLLKGKNLSLQELKKLNSAMDQEQNRASFISKEMVKIHIFSKMKFKYQRKMIRISIKISKLLGNKENILSIVTNKKNRNVYFIIYVGKTRVLSKKH